MQEQERLASLGTLAAGLAHELNNPAAAARSSVGRLAEALDEWDRASMALGALADCRRPAPRRRSRPSFSTRCARRWPAAPASRRCLIRSTPPTGATPWPSSWPDLGMTGPQEPAASLVALGWDGNELDDVLAPFGDDEARLVVAAWLAATALVRQVLAEVAMAAGRISEIVGAVREYTYLDRAPVQRIVVTAGIENTLVILRSKWKAGVDDPARPTRPTCRRSTPTGASSTRSGRT